MENIELNKKELEIDLNKTFSSIGEIDLNKKEEEDRNLKVGKDINNKLVYNVKLSDLKIGVDVKGLFYFGIIYSCTDEGDSQYKQYFDYNGIYNPIDKTKNKEKIIWGIKNLANIFSLDFKESKMLAYTMINRITNLVEMGGKSESALDLLSPENMDLKGKLELWKYNNFTHSNFTKINNSENTTESKEEEIPWQMEL